MLRDYERQQYEEQQNPHDVDQNLAAALGPFAFLADVLRLRGEAEAGEAVLALAAAVRIDEDKAGELLTDTLAVGSFYGVALALRTSAHFVVLLSFAQIGEKVATAIAAREPSTSSRTSQYSKGEP